MGAGDPDSVSPTVLVPAPGQKRTSRRHVKNVCLRPETGKSESLGGLACFVPLPDSCTPVVGFEPIRLVNAHPWQLLAPPRHLVAALGQRLPVPRSSECPDFILHVRPLADHDRLVPQSPKTRCSPPPPDNVADDLRRWREPDVRCQAGSLPSRLYGLIGVHAEPHSTYLSRTVGLA